MMIWAIVPLSRPDMLEHLVRCWEHQEHPDRRLCIVENGDAIGACERVGFRPDILSASGRHQSEAMNVGLEEVRHANGRAFAKWDDDDYYGPEYLSQIATGLMTGSEAVGKSAHFVQLSDGRILLKEAEGELSEVTMLEGPTLSGPISGDTPEFRVQAWGEDCAWVDDVRAAGGRAWAVEHNAFCYLRRPPPHRHTYPVTDAAVENFSRAMCVTRDAGRDLDTVDTSNPFSWYPQLSKVAPDFSLHPLHTRHNA